jgi:hypothetical protein
VLTALQQTSNPTLRLLTLSFIPYLFAPNLDSIPPLEPDALEHKFYADGVGNVLTVDEETGERLELVRITP